MYDYMCLKIYEYVYIYTLYEYAFMYMYTYIHILLCIHLTLTPRAAPNNHPQHDILLVLKKNYDFLY
jgi:hypothetical protein